MAYSEQVSRTGILVEVIGRIVGAVQPYGGVAARRSARKARPHPGGSLDPDILRDIGARREIQDYTASAAVSAGSDRRLHRFAAAARWTPLG